MRRGSRLAIIAGVCLLLPGCSEGSAPPEEPTPSVTAPPPPLETQPSATDGGTIEVTEIGFSVLDERDTGSAAVAWAATLTNSSGTDLLAYADFELTWRSADGETEVFRSKPSPLQRIYDVLPGRTGVIGGGDTVGFVPDSLDVAVDTNAWYPMRDLEANGLPVGMDVTDFRIEVETAVRVHIEFISAYERGGDEDLHLLVVMRDATGALIGSARAEPRDLPATPPGPHEEDGRVDLPLWPDEADSGTSEVTVVKVCCTWVGVT